MTKIDNEDKQIVKKHTFTFQTLPLKSSLMKFKNLLPTAFGLFLFAFVFQQCKSAQNNNTDDAKKYDGPVVTYEKNISAMMQNNCTPCHFPPDGKKEMLNTYEATKAHAMDILERVMLPPDDIKYMPFKEKKPAWTKEEIQTFKNWMRQGMPQ